MKTFILHQGGIAYEIELPDSVPSSDVEDMIRRYNEAGKGAPVTYSTGAILAQEVAPVEPGPPKGTGAGAKGAPVRRDTGAPVAQVPSGGPVSARPADRIEYYRNEVKALAAEKAELAPMFDAHEEALKSARSALEASHKGTPSIADPAIQAQRIKIHDKILHASIDWGRQARRYREVTAMISLLTTEIDRLLTKAPK